MQKGAALAYTKGMNWFFSGGLRRLALVLPLLVLLSLAGYAGAQHSGGGFGGRSSGSSSSSSGYSRGGSYGSGYSGGYSRGGGYGGPIIINNGYGGGWGYGGGGGGLGLLPLLIFGGVAIVVVMALMRGVGARRLGDGGPQGRYFAASDAESAGAIMVLVIMTEGDEVKRALQSVAQSGDPDTDEGLAQMLQEAALVALRHPERWAYGTVMRATGVSNQMDAQLGAWSTQLRAAFSEQTTSNYQNRDPNSGYNHNDNFRAPQQAGALYLAVSVGAAVRGLSLPNTPVDASSVRAALQTVSAVSPDTLIRAEAVWSPDAPGEFLTEDEAISLYPQAQKL